LGGRVVLDVRFGLLNPEQKKHIILIQKNPKVPPMCSKRVPKVVQKCPREGTGEKSGPDVEKNTHSPGWSPSKKCFFVGWKDQCVSSCWRNSLAKWRDTFTALENKVREEASVVSIKPLKTEERMVQAEIEIKGLLDALLKIHGHQQRDFSKEELKDWIDTQLGFKTQLCVTGTQGKKKKKRR